MAVVLAGGIPVRTTYLFTKEEELIRATFALGAWLFSLALLLCVSVSLVWWGAGDAYTGLQWGLGIALSAWFPLIGFTLQHFTWSTPKLTGLILDNKFKRPTELDEFFNLFVCSPASLGWKYPWERGSTKDYIDLRTVIQNFDEDFPTKGSGGKSQARGGPKVQIKGFVPYWPILGLLPRYIKVANTTIRESVAGTTTSRLGFKTARMTAEKARAEIVLLEKAIKDGFEARAQEQITRMTQTSQRELVLATIQGQVHGVNAYEWGFGIDVGDPKISDDDYEKDYQKALTDAEINRRIGEAVDARVGPKASKTAQAEAWTDALVVFGKQPREVFKVEGSAMQQLAGMLMNIVRRPTGGSSSRRP